MLLFDRIVRGVFFFVLTALSACGLVPLTRPAFSSPALERPEISGSETTYAAMTDLVAMLNGRTENSRTYAGRMWHVRVEWDLEG